MTVIGTVDLQNKTFSLHNITCNEPDISVTNNQLNFNYKDDQNRLVTYRKNISDLLSISRGDFLISSNIKDNSGVWGFCKVSKTKVKQKGHFGKVVSDIDWNDQDLEMKFQVLYFNDENDENRKAVLCPIITL